MSLPFATGSGVGSRRWPARFDTLRVKLFVGIAGANALLALATFLVFTWSFDQGFVEYLNRADESRLRPLVVRLADGYRKEGDWRWISGDRRRWMDLMREVFGTVRTPRRADEALGSGPVPVSSTPASMPAPAASAGPPALSSGGPPPDPLLTIDPRLLLFDADGRLLVGRDEMAREALRWPIRVDDSVVGYLGYVPRVKMVESLEKVFSAQQGRKFAALGAGMLIAGLVIGAFLAHWLSHRIRRLAQGAEALIHGDYDMRIESHGHDELAQLAHGFNQLAATLAAAQRTRQQWIGDIAHELRTPLAVLRAEIEALQDGVRPLGPASLGSLAQEVSQLTRLVEDLRLLSLSDLGALTYHTEPLDLGELIAESVRALAPALHDKGITLELRLAPEVVVVGDATRLAQVFANLLQNTLRYTDAPGRLQVRLEGEAGEARITWQDSSPGVPADALPHLTERLYRVDGSRSRSGGGSGLGLAITQAIVLAHRGRLVADAGEFGGLRWTIHIPRAERRETSHG